MLLAQSAKQRYNLQCMLHHARQFSKTVNITSSSCSFTFEHNLVNNNVIEIDPKHKLKFIDSCSLIDENFGMSSREKPDMVNVKIPVLADLIIKQNQIEQSCDLGTLDLNKLTVESTGAIRMDSLKAIKSNFACSKILVKGSLISDIVLRLMSSMQAIKLQGSDIKLELSSTCSLSDIGSVYSDNFEMTHSNEEEFDPNKDSLAPCKIAFKNLQAKSARLTFTSPTNLYIGSFAGYSLTVENRIGNLSLALDQCSLPKNIELSVGEGDIELKLPQPESDRFACSLNIKSRETVISEGVCSQVETSEMIDHTETFARFGNPAVPDKDIDHVWSIKTLKGKVIISQSTWADSFKHQEMS